MLKKRCYPEEDSIPTGPCAQGPKVRYIDINLQVDLSGEKPSFALDWVEYRHKPVFTFYIKERGFYFFRDDQRVFIESHTHPDIEKVQVNLPSPEQCVPPKDPEEWRYWLWSIKSTLRDGNENQGPILEVAAVGTSALIDIKYVSPPRATQLRVGLDDTNRLICE